MQSEHQCSLGRFEERNDTTKLCKGPIIARVTLSENDVRLLKIRSGYNKKIKYVCDAHLLKYIRTYAAHQTECCKPLGHPADNKVCIKIVLLYVEHVWLNIFICTKMPV